MDRLLKSRLRGTTLTTPCRTVDLVRLRTNLPISWRPDEQLTRQLRALHARIAFFDGAFWVEMDRSSALPYAATAALYALASAALFALAWHDAPAYVGGLFAK